MDKVKVRLHGTPEEVKKFAEWLEKQPRLRVLSVSDSYPDRGKSQYNRVYIDVAMLSDEEMLERLAKLGDKK